MMPGALSVDVLVQSPLWSSQADAETVVRGSVSTAAELLSTKPAELAILLTDDSAIRVLNRDWRGVDKPTNVLSFPVQGAFGAAPTQGQTAAPVLLGDIVIAYETTADEAQRESKPFSHHLAHLAIHGLLHLLGYDHDADSDAEAMEAIERAVLARLGIADPYAARDSATA